MVEYWDDKLLEAWEHFSYQMKKEETSHEYIAVVAEIMQFSQMDFWNLSWADVEHYYIYNLKQINTGQLMGSTVYKKFKILSSFSNYLVSLYCDKKPFYKENPFIYFRSLLRQYDQTGESKTVPLLAIDKLLDTAASDITMYTIITLIFRSALRPQDICSSRLNSLKKKTDGYYMEIEKNKKPYFVRIPDDASRILDSYLEFMDLPSGHNVFLFQGERKDYISIRMLQKKFLSLVAEANVPECTLYDIRSTSASVLFAYGATAREVANQLCITNINVWRYHNPLLKPELTSFKNRLKRIEVIPFEKRNVLARDMVDRTGIRILPVTPV